MFGITPFDNQASQLIKKGICIQYCLNIITKYIIHVDNNSMFSLFK